MYNCLHSLERKNKIESHLKVCEDKDFFNVVILFKDTNTLSFNQYCKAVFITYADLES